MQEMGVQSLGWEDPLEEKMVTYFSIQVWKIPRREEATVFVVVESDVTEQLRMLMHTVVLQNLSRGTN